MLFVRNDTNIKVKTKKLKEISQNLTKKDVDCLFLSSSKMQELNIKERSIDKTTDVLSFPLEDFPHVPLGSVVINLELAREVSEELGHSLEDECSLLFIHAMLHLLGFDHECDSGEMRKKESELIEKFKLPKSLIERNLDYS